MNSRKSEIEHEKYVVDVAKLVDTVGKVLIDAGQPPRVVALQAQITCNQYGVSLEDVAKAQVIPWTLNAPSAMNELQEQDPRLYAYCLQNKYEVQKTRHSKHSCRFHCRCWPGFRNGPRWRSPFGV